MNTYLIYVIVAAAVLLFMIGLVVGLLVAIGKMKKAMTKEQAAQAESAIQGVLKSLIVSIESKFTPYASWLKTYNNGTQKSGDIKKEIVLNEALKICQEKGWNIPEQFISSTIDNLVEFMNKKTPALNEEKKE